MNQSTKLGIIGFGNMAQAIVGGILKNKLIPEKNIYAYDNNSKQTAMGKKKFKIQTCQNLSDLCAKTNTILLSIKPQNINDVLPLLAKDLKNHLIISIVAGIEIKSYQKTLGKKVKLIRVMPNTPALIGSGAAAYYANKNCAPKDKKIAEAIFNSVGMISELKKESLINSVTAISGSGPAFVYQYAQSAMDAGVTLGLSKEISRQLVLQTLLGSTKLMLAAKESPDELTKKVTSKGGTTLAGLEVLKKKGFTKILKACMVRAAKRAEELAKIFGR